MTANVSDKKTSVAFGIITCSSVFGRGTPTEPGLIPYPGRKHAPVAPGAVSINPYPEKNVNSMQKPVVHNRHKYTNSSQDNILVNMP